MRNEDLWYTIGLIVTDGNLSGDGRHICITSKDRALLETVRSALHLDIKIGMKARGGKQEKEYAILQWSDVKFYRYLLGIGIHPNKSLILRAINVPIPYFKDFIRGVIDGDGNISRWTHKTNGHPQWSLRITSGAPIFANWILTEIERYYSVVGKLYSYKFKGKKNFIHIIKFGKVATKIILQTTYYSDCLALKRKLIKAQECLKSEDGWSGYREMVNKLPGC